MKVIFLLLVLGILCANGAKLLVFSMSGSKSHMISNGRIADALAEAGHDVTLASVEGIIETKEFPTTKLAKVVILGSVPDERKALAKMFKGKAVENAFKPQSLLQTWGSFSGFKELIGGCFDHALTTGAAKIEQLKAEKFDAIFYEQLFPHGAALGHLLNIDIHFLINSCPLQEHITHLFGIPNPTGYVPSVGGLSVSDKMSFFERARNEAEHHVLTYGYSTLITGATETFRKNYGSDFPDVRDIMREKVPLHFVAVNELIDFPRPIFHNIVYIGGLGMKQSNKNETTLKEPFESEMKKGKKGIVYFSLGSNCDSTHLPEAFKKNLLDSFSQFPDYHFVVKLEATDQFGINYAKKYKNIFVTNWAPQASLLQHERMKLFITHGGYNSLLEVAHSGVPVLLMPMMYDQTRNGQIVERNGWGKVLDKMELLEGKEKLVQVLNELLSNEKYSKNAHRIKHLLETKPFSANEIFLKNVKFVLENEGKLPELRPASMDLSFVVQNNLDVYLVFFSAVFAILLIAFLIVRFVLRFLLSLLFTKNSVNLQKQKKKVN